MSRLAMELDRRGCQGRIKALLFAGLLFLLLTGSGPQAIRQAERSIRDNTFETAIIFSPGGVELTRIVGTEDRVYIPAGDFAGDTMSHNHPVAARNWSLSGPDLVEAAHLNLQQIRVVSRDYYGRPTLCAMDRGAKAAWPPTGGLDWKFEGPDPASSYDMLMRNWSREYQMIYWCEVIW